MQVLQYDAIDHLYLYQNIHGKTCNASFLSLDIAYFVRIHRILIIYTRNIHQTTLSQIPIAPLHFTIRLMCATLISSNKIDLTCIYYFVLSRVMSTERKCCFVVLYPYLQLVISCKQLRSYSCNAIYGNSH